MFKQAQVPCWLRPYKIISTGNSTGLIAVSPISTLPSSYPRLLLGHRFHYGSTCPYPPLFVLRCPCQFVTDAISIDALKKSKDYPGTLLGHFEMTYGPQDSEVSRPCRPGFPLISKGRA